MRKTCAHCPPTLRLKIQDRSAGCRNRLSRRFSFTMSLFLETTNCDFHIFCKNKVTVYFKRAPVWDWNGKSLKNTHMNNLLLFKQTRKRKKSSNIYWWVNAYQLQNVLILWHHTEFQWGITVGGEGVGGRERKRLNVRERERESVCYDTSILQHTKYIFWWLLKSDLQR